MLADRKITVVAILLALSALTAGVYAGWNRPFAPADVNFIGVQGDQFAMSSLKGKVVLVNFWATSCSVCVAEMPKFEWQFLRVTRYMVDIGIDTGNKTPGNALRVLAVGLPFLFHVAAKEKQTCRFVLFNICRTKDR